MESGDADLIIHEEVPSTPDEVLEEIFQKMEEQPTIEELNCENGDSDDDNDIVSQAASCPQGCSAVCITVNYLLLSPPIPIHG
jgi:hypothetical protein